MFANLIRAGVVAIAVALTAPASASSVAQFSLASDSFAPNSTIDRHNIYNAYGCSGDNASPELHWSGAPAGTKSFALTAFDPDAPVAGGWWHWVLFNIPVSSTKLAADAGSAASGKAPKDSVEGTTSFGSAGYGGPCPPPGSSPHHYVFTLYALDTAALPGSDKTTGPQLLDLIKGHVLAKVELTGRYGR